MLAGMIQPGFYLYLQRLRAERERQTHAFNERLRAAKLARAAVNEQGVGE